MGDRIDHIILATIFGLDVVVHGRNTYDPDEVASAVELAAPREQLWRFAPFGMRPGQCGKEVHIHYETFQSKHYSSIIGVKDATVLTSVELEYKTLLEKAKERFDALVARCNPVALKASIGDEYDEEAHLPIHKVVKNSTSHAAASGMTSAHGAKATSLALSPEVLAALKSIIGDTIREFLPPQKPANAPPPVTDLTSSLSEPDNSDDRERDFATDVQDRLQGGASDDAGNTGLETDNESSPAVDDAESALTDTQDLATLLCAAAETIVGKGNDFCCEETFNISKGNRFSEKETQDRAEPLQRALEEVKAQLREIAAKSEGAVRTKAVNNTILRRLLNHMNSDAYTSADKFALFNAYRPLLQLLLPRKPIKEILMTHGIFTDAIASAILSMSA